MTLQIKAFGLRAIMTVAAVCVAACGDGGNSRDASDRDGGADVAADQGKDTPPDTRTDQGSGDDVRGDSHSGDVGARDGDVGGDGGDDADAGDGGGRDGGGGDDAARSALDACFAGLPAPVGIQTIADKSSGDGRVRVRIALDTMGMFGTSGSYAWDLIRLGVEIDGDVTCVSDASQLSYTGSHHNCSDSAAATDGTTRFELEAPDRPTMRLTIRDGGTVRLGPVTLTDTSCRMANSSGPLPKCISGGPC